MRGDTNFKGSNSSDPSVYFLFCTLNAINCPKNQGPDHATEAHCRKSIYLHKNNNGFNVSYLPRTIDSLLEGFMAEHPEKINEKSFLIILVSLEKTKTETNGSISSKLFFLEVQ